PRSQSIGCFRTCKNLPLAGQGGETRREVGDAAAGGEGPACAERALEPGGPNERRSRVDSDVNGEWLGTVPVVERARGGEESGSRVDRPPSVLMGVGVLEDRHEAIAGSLVDVAAALVNAFEKGREVGLDETIDDVGLETLREQGVPADIEE